MRRSKHRVKLAVDSVQPESNPDSWTSIDRLYKPLRNAVDTKPWLVIVTSTIALVAIGVLMYFILSATKTSNADDITFGPSDAPIIKIGNPLAGATLFVDPNSVAARQATAWRTSRPADAASMDKLAAMPAARWFTSTDSLNDLPAYLAGAAEQLAVPTIVAYNIPFRDCGRYSAGGATDVAEYRAYIDKMAYMIGINRVIVIVEPDAIPNVENVDDNGKQCLKPDQQKTILDSMSGAVGRLKRQPATSVYIDAGNNGFVKDTNKIAEGLRLAGIDQADGFSLNVSNFKTNKETTRYGNTISAKVGDKHYVIDTSRNGLGPHDNRAYPAFSFCNPPGRSLGHFPTVSSGVASIDAYLYVKYPGESDGQDPNKAKCQGGPRAGEWWPEYALGLIKRWPADLQPK